MVTGNSQISPCTEYLPRYILYTKVTLMVCSNKQWRNDESREDEDGSSLAKFNFHAPLIAT